MKQSTKDVVELVGVEFTRPADTNAYAAGDAMATTTTAGSVVPLTFTASRVEGFSGHIVGADLILDSATAFGWMRLWLFNNAPFAAAGYQADNSALALTYAALTTGAAGALPAQVGLIGYIDFDTFIARSSSALATGVMQYATLPYAPANASKAIYGVYEAMAAFTPKSAGKFTTVLHVVQD